MRMSTAFFLQNRSSPRRVGACSEERWRAALERSARKRLPSGARTAREPRASSNGGSSERVGKQACIVRMSTAIPSSEASRSASCRRVLRGALERGIGAVDAQATPELRASGARAAAEGRASGAAAAPERHWSGAGDEG